MLFQSIDNLNICSLYENICIIWYLGEFGGCSDRIFINKTFPSSWLIVFNYAWNLVWGWICIFLSMGLYLFRLYHSSAATGSHLFSASHLRRWSLFFCIQFCLDYGFSFRLSCHNGSLMSTQTPLLILPLFSATNYPINPQSAPLSSSFQSFVTFASILWFLFPPSASFGSVYRFLLSAYKKVQSCFLLPEGLSGNLIPKICIWPLISWAGECCHGLMIWVFWLMRWLTHTFAGPVCTLVLPLERTRTLSCMLQELHCSGAT